MTEDAMRMRDSTIYLLKAIKRCRRDKEEEAGYYCEYAQHLHLLLLDASIAFGRDDGGHTPYIPS